MACIADAKVLLFIGNGKKRVQLMIYTPNIALFSIALISGALSFSNTGLRNAEVWRSW